MRFVLDHLAAIAIVAGVWLLLALFVAAWNHAAHRTKVVLDEDVD